MSKPIHRLGDLQLRILKVLWAQPAATVAQVQQGVGSESDLAYTTVATMLRKMEVRGLVSHREEGRSFLYSAVVGAEEVGRGFGTHLVERLFEGSLTETVSHLLTTREVSRDELDELDRLIQRAKRRIR